MGRRAITVGGLSAALCAAALLSGAPVAGATTIPASASGGVYDLDSSFFFDDFAYTPSELALVQGGTATWSGDFRSHPLVFDNGPAGASAGITYRLKFDTPGAYQFHCRIHGAQGMRGALYVAGPNVTLRAVSNTTTDLRVQLDASGTDFVDFTPNTDATYEFDGDGNGVVDTVSSTPTTTYTYPGPGTYDAGVKVIDDDGRASEGHVSVVVAKAGAAAAKPGQDIAAPLLTAAAFVPLATKALRAGTTLVVGTSSENATVKGTLLLGASVIATASEPVIGGETITLKLKASKRGRRTLARKRPRSLRLRIMLTDPSGNAQTVVRTLRLRR